MKTALKTMLSIAAGLALATLLHLAMTASAAEMPAPSRAAVPVPLRVGGNYGGNFRCPILGE